MSTVGETYFAALKDGKDKGVLSADLRLLIAHDMGYPEPIDTLLHQHDEFTKNEQFEAEYKRLLNGEPVEYILQEARFLDYKLYVDNRVLIPRMETAELVANITENVDQYFDPRNYLVVADIGTGSGCIATALRNAFPNWLITASDISEGALEVAQKNFKSYAPSVKTLCGSGLEPYIEANMALDIIVSNPPYILNRDEVQDSVKDYEPESALYLDEGNSVYEAIFRDLPKVKKGPMLLAFEIGYDLKDYLTKLMAKYLKDYTYDFKEDLNGLTRFLFVYCR